MEKDQLSRKLAVILHADVVDSTSLVRRHCDRRIDAQAKTGIAVFPG
jgi:class 3 adenylate cyclase